MQILILVITTSEIWRVSVVGNQWSRSCENSLKDSINATPFLAKTVEDLIKHCWENVMIRMNAIKYRSFRTACLRMSKVKESINPLEYVQMSLLWFMILVIDLTAELLKRSMIILKSGLKNIIKEEDSTGLQLMYNSILI